MKEIPLTRGKVALIDDDDYPWISQFKWCAGKHYSTYYAQRSYWLPYKKAYETEFMHRRIMHTGPDFQVDHLNHNGLDNRKRNMRLCTTRQNAENQRNQSKHGIGVVKRAKCPQRPFELRIAFHGKQQKYIGNFATPEEAQEARKKFLSPPKK